jgi:signal peptidase I
MGPETSRDPGSSPMEPEKAGREHRHPSSPGPLRRHLEETIRLLLFAVALSLVIRVSVAEAYHIEQSSMENTLFPGDTVLGNKFLYGIRIPFTDIRLPSVREPRPGDIIVLDSPIEEGVRLVKRVVAVAGQTVEIRDKRLYVDGEPQTLPGEGKFVDERVLPGALSSRDNLSPVKVPQGRLFVMGDNRDVSLDSRGWGFLDRDLVQGQVMFVLYSWNDDPTLPLWSRLRWRRLGHDID